MFENKRVLVVGMARSGIPTVTVLSSEKAIIDVTDIKEEVVLKPFLKDIDGLIHKKIFGTTPTELDCYDYLILSPGVPTDLPFIMKARALGVKVIGEMELAYILSRGTFIGITGTNGKSTTTVLTGAIFKEALLDAYVVGNIGIAAISKALETEETSQLVTEVSSFQLESIDKFAPHIAAILNVTPDHLNRHKTMEKYIEAKCRIYENQHTEDYLVLNYDNEITRNLGRDSETQKVMFSRVCELERGVFIKDQMVHIKLDKEIDICSVHDIFISGDHNIENALAATAISYLNGIDPLVIKKVLIAFKGLEHRYEFVDEIHGVKYFNDSKATNPESTIPVIKSAKVPTIVIAGGMDKESKFDELFKAFNTNIKRLILLGETAEIMKETAAKYDFFDVEIVKTVDEAVQMASDLAVEGDHVVLSPACASWDMYESFEHRGQHFKDCVQLLRG